MSPASALVPRSRVKRRDTWDLSTLYADDEAWEKAFQKWVKTIGRYDSFRDTLGKNAVSLAACLRFDSRCERTGERLGTFAFLRTTEDTANSEHQARIARFRHAASRAEEAASFIRPEILRISTRKLKRMLSHKSLAPYRIQLERLLRYKPHTLSDREESLLAMQGEMAGAAGQIFSQLNDADLKFGTVKNEKGETVELAHASFAALLHSPKRTVRKRAFHQYYEQFDAHRNTLAATLAGSIHKDVYRARARSYDSALAAALFPDNVPQVVYDNLIQAVRRNLPALFRYYELRRKKMRLRELHHYDTYVPILSGMERRTTWEQATRTVIASLEPLGSEYVRVLEGGLQGRWCDRYPNRGKQSGAFSCGSYDGAPYILMNYEPTVLDHMFTLAHEVGHSMHSYYSAKHQPFEYYNYTIFVAEVASTFNEQLLSRYLLSRAKSDEERAYLINHDIDAIRGTVIRQTMFAEFEKITHEMAETGAPLTVEAFCTAYRELLATYFGPDFAIDDELSLECFRIPHFYRAFYVYKYATGLSAAVALAERVTQGGKSELRDYLEFLSAGCSLDPLDLLRGAGVDMESPQPVETTLQRFDSLVTELEELLG